MGDTGYQDHEWRETKNHPGKKDHLVVTELMSWARNELKLYFRVMSNRKVIIKTIELESFTF